MSEKKKVHPISLANLQSAWNSDTAKEAQLLGAKKRTANALLRKQLKADMKMWKEMQEDLADSKVDSVEILRMLAFQKLDEGDNDGAVDIFKAIAEFEKPKLARVESKVEEVKTDDLSDEELNEMLKKFSDD